MLKLRDADGRVSLTNLTVYVVLTMFVYVTLRQGVIDFAALGTLLTAMGAYRFKAHQNAARDGLAQELEAAKALIKDLQKAVRAPESRPMPVLPPGLR